jgi:hypothetical protein
MLHFNCTLAAPEYYTRIKIFPETNTTAYFAGVPSTRKGNVITLNLGVKIYGFIVSSLTI